LGSQHKILNHSSTEGQRKVEYEYFIEGYYLWSWQKEEVLEKWVDT